MTNKNTKYSQKLFEEADIFRTWCSLLTCNKCKDDSNFYILIKSIYFKLKKSRHHLNLALEISEKSNELISYPFNSQKRTYDFQTICEFDAFIHSLNSIMDILTKILFKVFLTEYSHKNKYFSNFFRNDKYLIELQNKHKQIAEIVKRMGNSKERNYVRKYCNEIKHENALFSSCASTDVDFHNRTVKTGFKIKGPKTNGKNKQINWLNDWAPHLEEYHRKELVTIGELMSIYLKGDCEKIDNNMLSYLSNVIETNY